MPRDSSGNYTLPAGNPVVDGTVIESIWANQTLSDIALQLNNVFTRDGLLGPNAPVLFVNGTVALPGIAFAQQPSSGLYRVVPSTIGMSVVGVTRQTWDATGTIITGTADISGDVTLGGALNVTGTIGPITAASLGLTGNLTVGGTTTLTGDANTVGKLTTAASTATPGAGFSIPHGVTPTTPVNGDIWTLTTGLVARINGANRTMATIQGANTFTAANIFSGTVAFNGGVTFGDVAGDAFTMVSNVMTVPTGGLTVSGGPLITTGGQTLNGGTNVGGILTVTGAANLNGGVTVGDAAADPVTFVSNTVTIPAGGINFTGGFFGINRAPTAQLDVMGTPASTAQVCALVYNAQSNVTASMCAMGTANVSHGPVPFSAVMLSTGSGNTPMWIGNWQAGTGAISLMTNGAERARLSDVGWMTIGKAGVANAVLDIQQTPGPAATGVTSILLNNSTLGVTMNMSVASASYTGFPLVAGSAYISVGSGNTPMAFGQVLAGTGTVSFFTNATKKMEIDASGNVLVTGTSIASGASYISLQNTQTGLTGALSVVGSTFASGGVLGSSFLVSTGAGNTNMSVGQYLTGTGVLLLHTNGAERMRITPEGNVGVAMTNPPNYGAGTVAMAINAVTQSVFDLAVNGVRVWSATTQAGSSVAGTVTNIPWNIITNGLTRFQFEAAGKVVVGTAAGLGQFTVHYQGPSTNGITISEATDSVASSILVQRAGITGPSLNFRVVATIAGSISHPTLTTTAYNTSSDARLKRNVRPVRDVGKIIDNIPVVSFDWKPDGIHVPVGLIAQDVHGVFPQAVHEGGADVNEDPWAIDHSKLVPLLLREIQSLRERVTALEE